VDESPDVARELELLEAELKRLEAEYNMFFAGRLPRPPWETRGRVNALVKRLDRAHLQSYGDRFRFSALQARFSSFTDLWDRGLRAREEGRAGPFSAPRPAAEPPRRPAQDRILCVTSLRDPMREMDKLHTLYDSLTEARRETGQDAVPFHKFVELVRQQMGSLAKKGTEEVAFRVAMKDGKVAFSARALRGIASSDE
jgi:hypothetical protein